MFGRRRRSRRGADDEGEKAPNSSRPQSAETLTDKLLAESRGDPAPVTDRLAAADESSVARALHALQRERGSAYVEEVVRGIAAHKAAGPVQHGGTGVGIGRGRSITVERDVDDSDLEAEAPISMDQTDIPAGATEAIGPETSSTFPLTASTLNDVAPLISGPDEAGKCTWGEHMDYRTTGTKMSSVSIIVWINVEMPAWSPPPSMLPKARAEWDRWYAALLAHEMGHVKLVHEKMDGLASRIVGMTERAGKSFFENKKAELRAASKAYDGRTGGGTKTGTIIDPTIEDKEIADKKKEEDAKRRQAGEKKAGSDVAPAPEGPEAG